VLVHTRGGAEQAGGDVGHVGEFEQALDGAILAEGAVEDGENNVDVDGAVGCAAGERCVGLKWRDGTVFLRFRGNHDGYASGQNGGAGCGFGIARAEMRGVGILARCFSLQQPLRVCGGQPAAFLGDANGDDFEFIFVDGLENRCGGEQRDFVLSAAPAEEDADAKFFHDLSVWAWRTCGVNCRR
jgi:hypothetical protein